MKFWAIGGIFAARVAMAVDMPLPVLRPPHDEIPPTFWEVHRWQFGGAAAVLLVIAGAVVLWLRRPRTIIVEPPAMIARRSLEVLRGRPVDAALVVEISRILRRYVWTALDFPPDELTTTEIRHTLQQHPQVGPELAAATGDFLRRCDEWKFAPDAPAPHSDVVQNAAELVEKIEATRQPQPSPEPVKTGAA